MPISYQFETTPGGHRYFQTTSSGTVTVEDAEQYKQRVSSPDVMAVELLTIIRSNASFSSEARRVFGTLDPLKGPKVIVFVVESGPLRVLMRFLFRVVGIGPPIFTTEAEATAHLDSLRS